MGKVGLRYWRGAAVRCNIVGGPRLGGAGAEVGGRQREGAATPQLNGDWGDSHWGLGALLPSLGLNMRCTHTLTMVHVPDLPKYVTRLRVVARLPDCKGNVNNASVSRCTKMMRRQDDDGIEKLPREVSVSSQSLERGMSRLPFEVDCK